MKVGWRTAFITQGESDFEIYRKLRSMEIEPCHYLHYLQMAAEKIAKGLSCKDEMDKPAETHHALVRWLRTAKARKSSALAEICHFGSMNQFQSYLQSLIDFASDIEALAPAVAKLRGQGPNAEYPWIEARTMEIRYPVEYPFFEIIRNPKLGKLILFIEASIKFAKIRDRQ